MPSEKDLLRCGRDELALQVVKFGGYENVARRLGLAFFDGKSRRMEEHIFRGAKRLWKERNVGRLLRTESYRTKGAETRKEQGLAWNQELVVEEL